MKKYLKFVAIAPLFMAVLCEEDQEENCGFEPPEAYTVNIENTATTYAANETIWLNAQTSSMLIDNCSETENIELVTDSELFIDGLFILKLNNQTDLNAEVFTDATINFDIGELFTFNACVESISYIPELTDNNQFYQYRLGVSVNTPGDYCVVSAYSNAFNLNTENNAQIFEAYNTLNDEIRFESCNTVFIRTGIDGHYFFRVQ
ncbi:hypothetical protein [uncultured Algibacter sp.]|uniref:hypothetical protein n=1 Tax=uncultured Algibacter sp. TaxID=298659 RepID=UPI0026348EBB|nr:hypothetical protein [uncultured Algibacter sp.]